MALQDPRPTHRHPGGEDEIRDATLAERARAGDADAFATLFRRYQVDVSRVCRRLLGVETASEDAVSESFLRARRALDGFAPDRPFRTWLLSIASHHCIDQLRRRSREQKIFDSRESTADEWADPGPSPLRRLVAREERDRLLTCIEELPEKYRLPLVLRYFSEMDYAAIADVLGVERVQVGTLLLRGRRRLRALLGSGGEAP
jgi:RNA polymerase sigma-70 factor (ECF subfamily)